MLTKNIMDNTMERREDFANDDAVKKLKELAEKIRVCMFCTLPDKFPLETRPMAVQEVDERGNIWFMSSIDSNKNIEIGEDNHIQLIFSDPSNSNFMTVHGKATISRDKKRIEELWNPIVKTWFTEGKDDPRITVISVNPTEAYYWDTKHNKMIAILKMAIGALTGKTMDDSVEGVLKP